MNVEQCMLLIKIEPFGTRFTEDPDKTYVLFVDGVHPSHRNPNFEWSRYLPSNIPSDRPLDRRSHDRLVITMQLRSSIFMTYSTGR